MRRKIGSLHSFAMLLVVGSLSGVLSACGGGSDGGPTSSSPPPIPQDVAKALDDAINADPASILPDLLDAEGSGAPADASALEETADAVRRIDGWDDNVYVRMNEADRTAGTPASTDTFVLYSNKDEPTTTPFHMVHPLDNNDSLIVNTDNVEMVSGVAEFPSAVNQVDVPFMADAEFSGMFNGATGTYTCVSMCSLSTNMNGALVEVGGEWQFAPDDNEFLVPVEDSNYVHFGYWMHKSEENGDPIIMVDAIAGGTAESPINTVQELEGRATYEGSATGVYVKRRVTPDGDVDNRRGGQFTADAILTATFGGGSVPANDHYSIAGSIDDFRDSRGRSVDSSWSVALEAALFGTQQSGALTGTNGNVFSGATEGDQGLMGAWNGRFFGPVVVDNFAAMPGNQPTFPSGVAGTFSGHFTNGDVLGAFGAEIAN